MNTEALRLLLTDDFLNTLAIALTTCWQSVDSIECSSFVEWCFEQAGKECPDLDELYKENNK